MSTINQNMRGSKNRGARWGGLVVLIVAAIFLIRGWHHHRALTSEPVAQTSGPNPDRALPKFDVPKQTAAEKKGIVLDSITLEKSEVCEGEENLVTIKAHGPDGTDRGLTYYMPGHDPGPQIPLRVYKGGLEGGAKVWITSRDGTQLEVPLPQFKFKDCVANRRLGLDMNLVTNSPDEFEFTARLVQDGMEAPLAGQAFVPKVYEWVFGDGSTETTDVPAVRHSYLDRPQTDSQSHFLIKVTARAANGETVVGRRPLSLNNNAYDALQQKKTIALMTRPVPRFGELFPDGTVRQRTKIWHIMPQPVTVTTVDIEEVRVVDGKDQLKRRTVPAREVLGTDAIPPEGGLEIPVVLDTKALPDVQMVNYTMNGTTADGYRVSGLFTIMVPIKPPTMESGTVVADEAMKAKILAAREILKKEYVSDEDLVELERQGRFRDLVPPSSNTPGN